MCDSVTLAFESEPCRCSHRRFSHTRDGRCLALDCHCTDFRLEVAAIAAQPDLPVEE